MDRIIDWSAHRSGNFITIEGALEDDQSRCRFAFVRTIALRDGRIIATDRDGDSVELVA